VVKGYDIYIWNKSPRYAPYSMLKLPSILSKPWILIIWNFVGKLPELIELITGIYYNAIFVITNRLTKYASILLYKITYIVTDIAYIFLREIITNHGILEEIISDRDKLFTSKF
jgi:hypothetical protein